MHLIRGRLDASPRQHRHPFMTDMPQQFRFAAVCLFLACTAWSSPAQSVPARAPLASTAAETLPDAPGMEAASSSSDDGSSPLSGQQKAGQPAEGQAAAGQAAAGQPADSGPSKRLFFIIPNFRSVRTTVVLPPQTTGQKFSDATKDTFDYSAFALEFLLAGYSDALRSTPEFGHGGIAYARYLWHSSADQTIENYMVEFIVPALTHEDTRYYQLGRGGFKKRTLYAITRTFVTKSDSDHEVVNLGELAGAAASAGISQTYYPRPERTGSQFISKYGTNLGIDMASYFLREFEPEISRMLARQKPAVSHD
jgi:hypothetical protein